MDEDLLGLIGGLNGDVAGLAQEVSALRTRLTAATPLPVARAAHVAGPGRAHGGGAAGARPAHAYMAKTGTQLVLALRRALEAAGGR